MSNSKFQKKVPTSKSSNSRLSSRSVSTLTRSEYLEWNITTKCKWEQQTITLGINKNNTQKKKEKEKRKNNRANPPHIEFHKPVCLFTFVLHKLTKQSFPSGTPKNSTWNIQIKQDHWGLLTYPKYIYTYIKNNLKPRCWWKNHKDEDSRRKKGDGVILMPKIERVSDASCIHSKLMGKC